MSEDYDNRNTGVLFKNDYKKENEKAPDYKGTFVDADNVEKDLAAWVRKTNAGKMLLSIKVSDKFVKAEDNQAATATPAFEDDSVPF